MIKELQLTERQEDALMRGFNENPEMVEADLEVIGINWISDYGDNEYRVCYDYMRLNDNNEYTTTDFVKFVLNNYDGIYDVTFSK